MTRACGENSFLPVSRLFKVAARSNTFSTWVTRLADFRSTDVFLFAQDDIRVASTLTLNLGLRLESSGGPSEAHNILANLDTSNPAPLGGGGSGPLGSIDLGGTAYERNENWGPRLGVAWNPGRGKAGFARRLRLDV